MTELDPAVAAELARLNLDAGRPLLVVDADEVLFHFMAGFETYLTDHDHYFDWASYALFGNVRRRNDDLPAEPEAVKDLIDRFFADRVEKLVPVAGAAAALDRLQAEAQILVLSNLPAAQRAGRERALAQHGLDYPLAVGQGGKGPALKFLTDRVGAPVVFIDDIPYNHKSVRRSAPETYCIHYIADDRLARLLPAAPDADHRALDWADIEQVVRARLARG